MGDYFSTEGTALQKFNGFNWIVAALFVVADMAGGGIVALPTAIVRCCKFVYFSSSQNYNLKKILIF